MNRRRPVRATTLCRLTCRLVLIVLSTAVPCSAQDDAGLLRTSILMPDSDEFYRNNTTGHRSYVELDAIQFTISTTNESKAAVIVDEAKFHEAFTVRAGANTPVAVTLEWITIRRFGSEGPEATSGQDAVRINPNEMLTWNVAIRRLDGQRFTWGEYSVSFTVGELRRALSMPNAAIWPGRLTEGTYERLVSIKAPTTPTETVRRWAIAAGSASLRGDYESALQAWTRASAIDPESARSRLPRLYVLTGRYKEAVSAYEEKEARTGLSTVELGGLAEAYIGVGAEAKAFDTLLQTGASQQSVADEIATIRKRLSDRALELRR